MNSYRNGDSINVKSIKRYGYSNDKIVAEVENINGSDIYVEFSGTGPLYKLNISKYNIPTTKYMWVDLTNTDLIRKKYVLRNWTELISIAIAIALFIFIMQQKNRLT